MILHMIFFLLYINALTGAFIFPPFPSDTENLAIEDTSEETAEVLHLFQVPGFCPKGYKFDWYKNCRKIFGFTYQ